MIALFTTACGNQGKSSDRQVENSATEEMSYEPDALELYERLMHSFSGDWMERESDPELYPPYYGGAYEDTDGTFVVAVTGDKEVNSERLADILGTDEFKVVTVHYSFRQMMQVMNRIDNFLFNASIPEDHPVMSRFAGAYPDVENNCVKVLLTTVNQESINAFKRDISDSPLVVFEQGEVPALF